ncbi:MAG: App1 family protein [Actinomycetes bacterium]
MVRHLDAAARPEASEGPPDVAEPEVRLVHRAARLEAAFERRLVRLLRRRGWRPQVLAYPTYGAALAPGEGWVRVLGRVLLLPPRPRRGDEEGGRGWRRFFTLPVVDSEVEVEMGGHVRSLVTGRGGYLDERVAVPGLKPGWQPLTLRVQEGETLVSTRARIVGAGERLGVISDIDDTVMVTALPRPLLAAWNTFVRLEQSRLAVPGMPELFRKLVSHEPGALVVYVSTGAWNVAPPLVRFLARHGFPEGPLLLTDWGPTADAWFRSGTAHKRDTLRRLIRELPHLSWVLVGDDGQHDPQLYSELVEELPDRVRLVAIRELSPTEQVLTHGTPTSRGRQRPRPATGRRAPASATVWLSGADGFTILDALDQGEA